MTPTTDSSRPTLGLYAIGDRYRHQYPAYVHDHNLCLMQDGQILHYLHLERYTRRKYDNRLAAYLEEIIDTHLPELKTEDFDLVSVDSFAGRCWISQDGRLRFEAQAGTAWFQTNAWEGKPIPAWCLSHELAHVYSALPFFPDLPDNTLLVHFDGGASVGNFSAFHYHSGQLVPLEAHWHYAQASKWFNDNALHFQILDCQPGQHTSMPGKWMGFASHGTYRPELAKWLAQHEYFKNLWDDLTPFYTAAHRDFGQTFSTLSTHEPFLQDIAATVQHAFQEVVLEALGRLKTRTGATTLYYTGGCALNIVANSLVVQHLGFDRVCIPPCCNDSGLGLGAAAWLEWHKHGRLAQASPYLNTLNAPQPLEPRPETVQQAAACIANGGVIGVCNGPAEAGPRALGNRSLLARADNPDLTRHVSMGCKRREWYRPTAPVMLLEEACRVTTDPVPHELGRYMLLDFRIRPEARTALAGVTHVNGTARIQTLAHRAENPFVYDLLTHVRETYGLTALINTSFNSAGEPIVHTPGQAVQSALNMNLNGLVLNQEFYPDTAFNDLIQRYADALPLG